MPHGAHIDGLGDRALPVRLARDADFSRAALSAQEGFVLSRIDGSTTIEMLCVISGLGENTTVEILRRLHAHGLISVGDERTAKPQGSPAPAAPQVAAPSTPVVNPEPVAGAARASVAHVELPPHEEGLEIKVEVRQRLRMFHSRLREMNFFELLEVDVAADTKEIRRAYFSRSKEFHPDRYFNRNIGPYKEMLAEVFKQIAAAYKFLEDEGQRLEYRETLVREAEEAQLRQQLREQANEVLAAELGIRASASGTGLDQGSGEYSFVRNVRARAVSERGPRSDAAVGEEGEAAAPSTRRGAGSVERPLTGPVAPASVGAPASQVHAAEPVAAGAVEEPAAEDPEREARREQDRQRRRRLTGANPVLARQRRARGFFESGVKQMEAGTWLAAAASFKLAITFDETDAEYQRRYEEAVDKSRSQTGEGYFKRALFEESVGRLDAAGQLFARAADVFPCAPYLQKAARAMLWAEDLNKAKEYATKAVQVDPTSADARLSLARVCLAAGLKKNARREVDMALRLDPKSQEAQDLLKEIRRG